LAEFLYDIVILKQSHKNQHIR